MRADAVDTTPHNHARNVPISKRSLLKPAIILIEMPWIRPVRGVFSRFDPRVPLDLPRDSAGFPTPQATPVPLPAPPNFVPTVETLTRALPESLVESLPGGMVLITPPLLARVTEARQGGEFSQGCLLYVPREDSGQRGLFLRAAVYHTEGDRELALRSARLCARLLRLFQERFGQEAVFPRDTPTARVYLLPPRRDAPNFGGESFSSGEVYLYLSGVTRTGLEQVRTLVHEWGHLTIPAARGYLEPEPDASGYLGERLYMKWLHETGGNSSDGTNTADLSRYYSRQIAPLLAQYASGGPASRQMDGRLTPHMDYYIAAALGFEEAFGSRLLGRALFSIEGVAPRDLLAAMRATITRASTLPVRLPAWVPLPAGKYAVTGNAPGSVLLAGRTPVTVSPKKPLTLTFRPEDWKKVRGVSGSVRTLTLRRLSEAPL